MSALKELPDDPAALKRAAQEKRKNKMADEEGQGSNVRQMMTGVTKGVMLDFLIILTGGLRHHDIIEIYHFTDLDIVTL